jgi:hypothetical protein
MLQKELRRATMVVRNVVSSIGTRSLENCLACSRNEVYLKDSAPICEHLAADAELHSTNDIDLYTGSS